MSFQEGLPLLLHSVKAAAALSFFDKNLLPNLPQSIAPVLHNLVDQDVLIICDRADLTTYDAWTMIKLKEAWDGTPDFSAHLWSLSDHRLPNAD
jgi:hypothetical protein